MKRINRIISSIVLVSFLLNTAISDLAFGLAPSYRSDDIVGIEPKDAFRIEWALQQELTKLEELGELNEGTLKGVLSKKLISDNNNYNPADVQLFLSEYEVTRHGLYIKPKIKDRYGVRTYHVLFYLVKNPEGKFPVEVYSEKDKPDIEAALPPKQKSEFIDAANRYARHEEGVDTVIKYAHENNLAAEPIENRLSYKLWVTEILKKLNVVVKNPENLILPEDRKFYLVKMTPAVKKMMKAIPASVVTIDGVDREVAYLAHSSNGAVHVFVSEKSFDMLTKVDVKISSGDMAYSKRFVRTLITHELGVMLGVRPHKLNQYGIGEYDYDSINTLDERFVKFTNDHAAKFSQLELNIVNLDTNLATRDYAAGEPVQAITEITVKPNEIIPMGGNYYFHVISMGKKEGQGYVEGFIVWDPDKGSDSKRAPVSVSPIRLLIKKQNIAKGKSGDILRTYSGNIGVELLEASSTVARLKIINPIKPVHDLKAAASEVRDADELRGVDEAIAKLKERMSHSPANSLKVIQERKDEVVSAARYMKALLPESNKLTPAQIIDCIVPQYTNWLHAYRHGYGQTHDSEELLPPTFTFTPDVYPEYPGEKPRYISLYLRPQFLVLQVINSRVREDGDVSAKGGDRLVYLDNTAFIVQMKGDKNKKVKAALLQVADLSSTMKPKSLWWASGFDGSKTFSMANTEMLGITKSMTNKEKSELIKKELLPCVASFISAGILCGMCRFGPDMNTGELQDVIIDEAYKVQKELGVEHPILASTSGDPERGSFSHAELRATSLGAIETLLSDLENPELMKRYGVDPKNVTLSIMGFGEVTTGEIYWLKENYPELADKIHLCGFSNVPQDDKAAGGGIWNARGFSWDECVRLADMRNKNLRTSGGIDTFRLLENVSEPCRRLSGLDGARDILFQGADIVMPAAVADVFTSVEDIKRLKEAGTKMLFEPANNSITPNVIVTADEIRRNIPSNMTVGQLEANLKKYENKEINLEDVFDIFNIYLKHGPITNGGGIRASREQVEHWEREGRDVLINKMHERGIHVQDDIADMAILHTLWLTDKYLQTGMSPFRSFLEGVSEIENKFYELLNNPDNEMKNLTESYCRANARMTDARHFAAADLSHDQFFLEGLEFNGLIKELDSREKTIYGRETKSRMAAFALGRIKLTDEQRGVVAKKMIGVLQDTKRDPQVRKSAAECLGFILAKEALPALTNATSDSNRSVVVWAKWAVERIKTISSDVIGPAIAMNVEAPSFLDTVMPAEVRGWLDGYLTLAKFGEAVTSIGNVKGEKIRDSNKSILIFSELAAFGKVKSNGEYEEGLACLLPSFIKSNVKVAVVATTLKQQELIDGYNLDKDEGKRIIKFGSIAEAVSSSQTIRRYYVRDESEPEESGITNIAIVVHKILEAIGKLAGITDSKIIELMHEAGVRVAQAA